ncbi:hypothetical protein EDB85DRAFT_1898786 [Lactarius pseudohatsudake]|nr:hypothetical protein EDB85DRAFT_1898786 [Lactarius pseudohatsudake]
MQWSVSPRLAAIASLFLLFAGDLVVAKVDAPICTESESSWAWSFNSLDQNPCLVSAHLMATCYYRGDFTLGPLLFVGDSYPPPTKEQVLGVESCFCSTVMLSLLSACSECQEGLSTSWTEYSQNCVGTIEPSTFSHLVPAGTRVPQWALLDITFLLPQRANIWNATAARIVGDSPEVRPGKLIKPSSGRGPNTGAIAGGVAGGVIAIVVIAGLMFAFWRRRRRAQEPSPTSVVDDAPPPPSASQMGQFCPAPSHDTPVRPQTILNDPDDTTTYPSGKKVY